MTRRRSRSRAALVLALALPLGCGVPQVVNDCDRARAEDRTGRDSIEIEFAGRHGHSYAPACVRASVGTRLVFRGPFELHPLGAGRPFDETPEPAPTNPIRDTAEGEQAVFVPKTSGAYGFFCHFHTGEGMMGAVFVD